MWTNKKARVLRQQIADETGVRMDICGVCGNAEFVENLDTDGVCHLCNEIHIKNKKQIFCAWYVDCLEFTIRPLIKIEEYECQIKMWWKTAVGDAGPGLVNKKCVFKNLENAQEYIEKLQKVKK